MLLDVFKQHIKKACLQRDSYLDIVLLHEAKMLEKEMTVKNSFKAKKYIQKGFKALKPKSVSLTLSEETIELLDNVCKKRNIPRDIFICRVMFFLTFKIEHFESLLGIKTNNYIHNKLPDISSDTTDQLFSSGLDNVACVIQNDPFWVIRESIDYENEEAVNSVELLHRVYIEEDFAVENIALNCFVEDWRIKDVGKKTVLLSFDDLLTSKKD